MAGVFVLKVKDGNYTEMREESSDFAEILTQFLAEYEANNYEGGAKVTLTFRNKARKATN